MYEKEIKFKDIKVGDSLLVEYSHFSESSFYIGQVTKVTGTRFNVKAGCFNKEEGRTFTKDGHEYPRSTGYGRVYIKLRNWDTEGEQLVRKHKLSVKARNLADRLNALFGSANVRRRMTALDLDPVEIEETIGMLEETLKRFEKYAEDKNG